MSSNQAQRPAPKAQPTPVQEPEADPFEESEDQQGQVNDELFSDQESTEGVEGDTVDDAFFSTVLDLTDVEEPEFQLLPPGTYDCTIIDVEAGFSSNENPMMTWRLQTQDGQGKNRELRFFTMLTPDGQGRTKKTIRRIVPDYDLASFVPANLGEELAGMECRALVRIRPYQGERRNSVTDLLAPASSGFPE
jgi:hypothetical protein